MIQAINNYCLLEMIRPPEEISYGNIVLPNSTVKNSRWGTVKSVGPGVPDFYGNLLVPDVSLGDLAYVSAHGQFDVWSSSLGSENQDTFASALDILAIMTNKEKLEIQPLGSFIEIEPIDFENTGGISLPDSKKAPANRAKVISTGPGLMGPDGKRISLQVRPGDIIIYNPLRTVLVDFITLGHETTRKLIQHNDILGVEK